jgi:hypothetical protein
VRFDLSVGLVRVRGVACAPEVARAAAEIAARAALAAGPISRAADLAGRRAWIKGDHMPGAARWRHSLARAIGVPPPALREHAALSWLRARLFRAPEPLAAGWAARAGLLRYQFLATERFDAVEPLERAWSTATKRQRSAWLAELACEVARMHALRFVHRDLHLRNVLASVAAAPESGDPRALLFVDARRGGHPLPGRDAAYDLACLLLEGASLLSLEEQRALFDAYVAERGAQGSPVDARRLAGAIERRRARLVRRIESDPRRWRLDRALVRAWSAAHLVGRTCG